MANKKTQTKAKSPSTKKTAAKKPAAKKPATKKVKTKKAAKSGRPQITYNGKRPVVSRQGIQFIRGVPNEIPANDRLAEHKLAQFVKDPDFTVE